MRHVTSLRLSVTRASWTGLPDVVEGEAQAPLLGQTPAPLSLRREGSRQGPCRVPQTPCALCALGPLLKHMSSRKIGFLLSLPLRVGCTAPLGYPKPRRQAPANSKQAKRELIDENQENL